MLPPSDLFKPLLRWAVTYQHHPQPFMSHTMDLDMKTIAWGQHMAKRTKKAPPQMARWAEGVRFLWEMGVALQLHSFFCTIFALLTTALAAEM